MQTISIDKVIVGERQRTVYEDIEKLAESLKTFGFLQPLLLDENFELIAGGRRLQAAKLAGLTEVAFVHKEGLDPFIKKEMELEENIQRADLTTEEEVFAVKSLDETKKARLGDKQKDRSRDGWSLRQTAEMLNRSPGGVSQDIVLAKGMEIFPELRGIKSKAEGHKLLKKLIENVAIKEIAKREMESPSDKARFAESHYKIGDVVEGLKSLSDGVPGFAFAEVDPPYGVNLNKTKKVRDEKSDRENIDQYEEVSEEDHLVLIFRVAVELYRALADNAWVIWWFPQQKYEDTRNVLENVGFEVDPIPAIWHKARTGGQTGQPDHLLGRIYETFFIARKGKPAMHKRGKPNVFHFTPVPAVKKIHPTEKPINLMTEILDIFTFPESGTIGIVPFLGSGVTLRALYKRNLVGFGWDLSGEYKEKFLARLVMDGEEEETE